MIFDVVSRLPVVGFSAAEEHRRLSALNDESQALLAEGGGRLFEPHPEISGWSPAQHFFHCAAIAEEVLGWVGARCRDDVEGETGSGPNGNGYFVLLLGRIPRGRAETPGAYVPPERPDRDVLATQLDGIGEMLRAIAPHRSRLEKMGGRMKHPRMGMLNPREWLRFLQIHTQHHQRIVREIARDRKAP